MKPITIDDIINKVEADALKRRDDAGYGGEHHDGGYSHTMDCIRFYRLGKSGGMPDEWNRVKKEMLAEIDAEYKEYIRLCEKFKGL